MERWSGRVAVVTGASGGIGGAVARVLVNKGMKVVGLDCKPIDSKMPESLLNAPGKLHSLVTDLTKEEEILSAFSWVKENLGGVDVLVNCAGVCMRSKLSDGDPSAWKQMLEVNVLALSICTREAIKSMRERAVDDGHIVHMCSVAGHYVFDSEGIAMYGATKHAVRALAEGLRKELHQSKSQIRITNISPGGVNTDLFARVQSEEKLKLTLLIMPEDVADAIVYSLSTPPRVQVHEIIIRATSSPK